MALGLQPATRRKVGAAQVAQALSRLASFLTEEGIPGMMPAVEVLPSIIGGDNVGSQVPAEFQASALEAAGKMLRAECSEAKHDGRDIGLQLAARALGVSPTTEVRRARPWHERHLDQLRSLLSEGQTLLVVLGQEGRLPPDTAAALGDVVNRIRGGLLAGAAREV